MRDLWQRRLRRAVRGIRLRRLQPQRNCLVQCQGLPSANWGGIAFGNGIFVAVAYDSDIAAYSSNGIVWNSSVNASNALWYSTAFANGLFVAPAIGSTNASYSANGITWNSSASPLPDQDTFYTVAGNPTATNVPIVTSDLMAWWRGTNDNGTSLNDSSGNEITMTLENGPFTWGSDFLTFNSASDQYGDAGASAAQVNYSDVTVCGWVNKNGYSEKGIVDKSSFSGATGWGLWVQSDGHLSFVTGYNNVVMTDTGPATVIPGQWTFVAAVWNESSQSVQYYYSAYSSETPQPYVSAIPTTGSADLQLGNMQDNLSDGLYAFDGSMHDIAIYSHAISSNEILTNFLATQFITNNSAVPVPDLLEYKMTEGSSSTNVPQFLVDGSIHGGTTGTYLVGSTPFGPTESPSSLMPRFISAVLAHTSIQKILRSSTSRRAYSRSIFGSRQKPVSQTTF